MPLGPGLLPDQQHADGRAPGGKADGAPSIRLARSRPRALRSRALPAGSSCSLDRLGLPAATQNGVASPFLSTPSPIGVPSSSNVAVPIGTYPRRPAPCIHRVPSSSNVAVPVGLLPRRLSRPGFDGDGQSPPNTGWLRCRQLIVHNPASTGSSGRVANRITALLSQIMDPPRGVRSGPRRLKRFAVGTRPGRGGPVGPPHLTASS